MATPNQQLRQEREYRQKVKARYLRRFPCRKSVDYHFLRFKHIDHRMNLADREAML